MIRWRDPDSSTLGSGAGVAGCRRGSGRRSASDLASREAVAGVALFVVWSAATGALVAWAELTFVPEGDHGVQSGCTEGG